MAGNMHKKARDDKSLPQVAKGYLEGANELPVAEEAERGKLGA